MRQASGEVEVLRRIVALPITDPGFASRRLPRAIRARIEDVFTDAITDLLDNNAAALAVEGLSSSAEYDALFDSLRSAVQSQGSESAASQAAAERPAAEAEAPWACVESGWDAGSNLSGSDEALGRKAADCWVFGSV